MQQINLEQIVQKHYVQVLNRTKTNTSVSTENQTFWKLSVWILQFNEGGIHKLRRQDFAYFGPRPPSVVSKFTK